jgi:hypothetical protein
MKLNVVFFLVLLAAVIFSCNTKPVQGDWITGTETEQLNTTEKHFRGLDVAMMEIGHRYQELYWAGQDENWEYATYQLDKIKLSLTHAIERRPLRKESGDYFLQNDFPLMYSAVQKEDTAIFNESFRIFTISCNACHTKEKVPFFHVNKPVVRTSVISK